MKILWVIIALLLALALWNGEAVRTVGALVRIEYAHASGETAR